MRIDGFGRVVSGGSSATRNDRAGAFRIADQTASEQPRQAAPIRAAPQLDALLALQSVQEDGPRERRRRQIARGRGLLDALDGLKLALIDGGPDLRALTTLTRNLAEKRIETGDAGLDEALDAIELRAQVELAKRGA